MILVLGVAAPSLAYEYCVPHPQRPCFGVRKTLSEAGAASPFASIDVGSKSSPMAVDWDGDGHLDLLLGGEDGRVELFRGSADGSLSQQTGDANPFADVNAGSHASPEAVDWDGDGHLDLLLGGHNGTIHFYRGSADGNLSLQTGDANPFAGIDVGLDSSLKAVDWDGDGHLDLFLGSQSGTMHFYWGAGGNVGPMGGADLGLSSSPEIVDWDGDGLLDMLSGFRDGTVHFYRGGASGNFLPQTGTANPFGGINVGGYSKPRAVDWDGDGHLDLLVGAEDGTVRFYQGGADGGLSMQPEAASPFAGIQTAYNSTLQAVDWDGDGLLDLLVGEQNSKVVLYWGRADGSLSVQTDPFKDIDAGWSPKAVDWDSDGHLDLLVGTFNGTVLFYKGSADGRLSQPTDASNPFKDIIVGLGAAPEAVDWDGDGHLDLLVGEYAGTVRFYRGSANGSLSQPTDAANPFKDIHVGLGAAPKAVDWDGDGHLDLLVGEDFGTVRFYRGSANGSLSQLAGAANPFADIDVGSAAAPEAVDWDGDGRLDLLLRSEDGRVRTFSARCDHAAEVCSFAGLCQRFLGRCECIVANDGGSDCSLCADFFFSEGTLGSCQPCPGEGTSKGPCSRPGTCWDSKAAREVQRSGAWMPKQLLAPANGTCACEVPFSGDDCGQGECPPGKELTLTDTHVKRSSQYPVWEACTACAVGQYKATPGNTSCSPCPPGHFQSTSGAARCDQCPQGRKQPLSGSSFCEDCEAGTAPNSVQTLCEVCSPGRQAGCVLFWELLCRLGNRCVVVD